MKPTGPQLKMTDYDYDLPEQRIAKYPLPERDMSKLLVWRAGNISCSEFRNLGSELPGDTLLVFNDTKVVRARLIMHKPSGARIEIFCLEPHEPADYERAFAAVGSSSWSCIVGNSKKWKEGALTVEFEYEGAKYRLEALREPSENTSEQIIRFCWDAPLSFGQLLEQLGRTPIPPYLGRESQQIDEVRYQTVYSRFEGSVAAPTAGLHFSDRLMEELRGAGTGFASVTLHVGAGTFLPVKQDDPTLHHMHTEHFDVTIASLDKMVSNMGRVVAVGTTTVRTIESLAALGYRILRGGDPRPEQPVGQWELYDIDEEYTGVQLLGALLDYMKEGDIERIRTATQIMIVPGFRFRVTDGMITNFHQPKSTLLLLVSAFTGGAWREIYDYAAANDFRFLSYGDSSLLLPEKI